MLRDARRKKGTDSNAPNCELSLRRNTQRNQSSTLSTIWPLDDMLGLILRTCSSKKAATAASSHPEGGTKTAQSIWPVKTRVHQLLPPPPPPLPFLPRLPFSLPPLPSSRSLSRPPPLPYPLPSSPSPSPPLPLIPPPLLSPPSASVAGLNSSAVLMKLAVGREEERGVGWKGEGEGSSRSSQEAVQKELGDGSGGPRTGMHAYSEGHKKANSNHESH